MGSKAGAKELMAAHDVPVVPGYTGENQDAAHLQREADRVGYPLMIKAAHGGGGKGMRIVRDRDEFLAHLESCQREAKSAFGRDRVLLERYVQRPRHIEIQVFGDHHGAAIHLNERECSAQRRYQKVLEESPSALLTPQLRQAMGAATVLAVRAIDYVNAGWLIFGDGFNQGVFRPAIKRVFDIVIALLLLAVSAPVTLLTMALIALSSRGPIFYTQPRVGLNGKPFKVIKFRSMKTDAELDGTPRWALAGDDRVTPLGKVIRKFRIDELPQLMNVLMGEMSMVGPRPERPFFVDKLVDDIPYYSVRHSVKPGLTGWAQVRYHYGATVDDSQQKLQYDLYYVKNHTLFLDLLIMLETVAVVLTGKGAH